MKKSNHKSILDQIMTGINYMLPLVVAGGILMGIGYMVDQPAHHLSNYGYNTPLAKFFSTLGSNTFGYMLPVLSAGISYSISGVAGIPAALMAGAIIKTGTSGFLGALFGGFLAGYATKLLQKMFAKMPEAFAGLRQLLLIPLLSVMLTGLGTVLVIEPLIGQINQLMNAGLKRLNGASQILLGCLLGGMQSVDMGGPVNKTAYLFATSALASGQYTLMSAVLAGGIIPPYVTALATTIFKNKFTAAERSRGITNYLVGLAGITETGLPFLVSDPLRVMVACIPASAIAGGLSIYFHCSVMAPFGGIFILPLNSHPLGFLIAMISGIIVGTLILGLLKPPLKANSTTKKAL